MRLAAIDIGSNTTLLLVVEKTDETFSVLEDKIYFTRLAEGLSVSKKLSSGALFRLTEAFQSIQEILEKFRPDQISAVATSACREAVNQEELFQLGEKFHISPIEIISAKREAELTFTGAIFGLGQECEDPLVVDIGGGSTELVSCKKSYSFNMGSVTLTEKLQTAQALTRMDKISLTTYIENTLKPVKTFLQERDYKPLIFVAGTPITLAFMEKETSDPNHVHGEKLTEEQVHFWLEKLAGLSLEERKKIPHLPEHRSDVIVAGLAILKQILSATGKKEFIVSATGVRYGLILEQC
ncbi:MAG: hypothetical protein OXB86_02080 [Bdellovibrionales bacterium]|nr:hypothetical protein [Bdellovibrionales bacterium]